MLDSRDQYSMVNVGFITTAVHDAASVGFSDNFSRKLANDQDHLQSMVMNVVNDMQRFLKVHGVEDFLDVWCSKQKSILPSFNNDFFEFASEKVRFYFMLNLTNCDQQLELLDYIVADDDGGGDVDHSMIDFPINPATLSGGKRQYVFRNNYVSDEQVALHDAGFNPAMLLRSLFGAILTFGYSILTTIVFCLFSIVLSFIGLMTGHGMVSRLPFARTVIEHVLLRSVLRTLEHDYGAGGRTVSSINGIRGTSSMNYCLGRFICLLNRCGANQTRRGDNHVTLFTTLLNVIKPSAEDRLQRIDHAFFNEPVWKSFLIVASSTRLSDRKRITVIREFCEFALWAKPNGHTACAPATSYDRKIGTVDTGLMVTILAIVQDQSTSAAHRLDRIMALCQFPYANNDTSYGGNGASPDSVSHRHQGQFIHPTLEIAMTVCISKTLTDIQKIELIEPLVKFTADRNASTSDCSNDTNVTQRLINWTASTHSFVTRLLRSLF